MSSTVRPKILSASTALLTLVLLAGFYLRVDSYETWSANKERFYFDNQTTPLMLTADAYYYLDIAKQLRTDTFVPMDMRRRAPEGFERNPTPPLLSVLAATLTDISGLKLESIAIVLPAVLGALAGIPAYLVGVRLYRTRRTVKWLPVPERAGEWLSAAQIAGLITAALTLTAPKLVQRSGLGWFDTDGLNVFFSLMAIWLALRLLDSHSRKSMIGWLGAGAINLLLFLWSWDQTLLGPLALAGGPIAAAALALMIREPRNIPAIVVTAMLALAALVLWKGISAIDPSQHIAGLTQYLDYFRNEVSAQSPFPDSGRYVSEQSGISFDALALDVSGSLWVLAAAAFGVVILLWLNPLHSITLIPLLIVAMLAVEAQRFSIFVSPLVGVGIAAFAWLAWQLKGSWVPRAILASVILSASAWQATAITLKENNIAPRRTPDLFDAMLVIKNNTPEDTLLWGSWGHGHALIHYTDRATIADGIYHPAELSYVINYPFTVNNYRLAANWIQFYAAHGIKGLIRINETFGSGNDDWVTAMPRFQQLLAAGPDGAREMMADTIDEEREAMLAFMFPSEVRPVVLYLEHLHAFTAWYEAGAWDFKTRTAPGQGWYLPLQNARPQDNNTLMAASQFGPARINIPNGQVDVGNQRIQLSRLEVGMRGGTQAQPYDTASPMIARVNLQSQTGIVGTSEQVEAIYSSLFYALTADQQYFKPLQLKPPLWGLWYVHGEPYVPSGAGE